MPRGDGKAWDRRANTTKRRLRWTIVLLLLSSALASTRAQTWTTPVTLSEAGQDAANPKIALDGTGFAVWQRQDGVNWRIQAARLLGTGWRPPETLSEAGQDAISPQPNIAATTTLRAVWQRQDGV